MWDDDVEHGEGRLTEPNGTRYVGEFVKGKRDGRGVITRKSGYSFDGSWH